VAPFGYLKVAACITHPNVSGDPSQGPATLSNAAPMPLHRHDGTTSVFVHQEDRAGRETIVPPPPLVAVFGRLLHTHKPLTSHFAPAVCRLWGQFVGSYSTWPSAEWRGAWATSGRHAAASRIEASGDRALHRARVRSAHAHALLNDLPWCTCFMGVEWRGQAGFESRRLALPRFQQYEPLNSRRPGHRPRLTEFDSRGHRFCWECSHVALGQAFQARSCR
jgi:hypothetical protein